MANLDPRRRPLRFEKGGNPGKAGYLRIVPQAQIAGG